jgi:hypothetical protein
MVWMPAFILRAKWFQRTCIFFGVVFVPYLCPKDKWIKDMLTHLGQMNHNRDQPGVMTLTLSSEDRRELVATGWELL